MIPYSLPVKLILRWSISLWPKTGLSLPGILIYLERRAVTNGKVKALLIKSDNIEEQIKQVIHDLHLNDFKPFTLCLEDNQPLVARTRDEVKNRVPPYVWKTQKEYVECPECHRIYWKGTHWDAMTKRLEKLTQDTRKDKT